MKKPVPDIKELIPLELTEFQPISIVLYTDDKKTYNRLFASINNAAPIEIDMDDLETLGYFKSLINRVDKGLIKVTDLKDNS